MAESNRVSIPKELIPYLKAEAESLLLTDDLTAAVAWVLRRYFKERNSNAPAPIAATLAESLTDLDDIFAA